MSARRDAALRILMRLGYEKAAALIIGILFIVGAAAHLWPATLALMVGMTPAFLLLCALAVLLPALRAQRLRFLIWVLLAWAFTFALEALGVATGLVFGAYRYGPVLGPMLLEVPVLIALNWVLVIHGAWALSRRLLKPGLAAVILASGLATAFDWIMEPVAIALEYWTWANIAVPLQNYAAWFVIAFAAAGARWALERRPGASGAETRGGEQDAERARSISRGADATGSGDTLALAYLLVQAAFFALLRVGWAWFPAAG